MMIRGHYIGKIVDDLSVLKYQVETRNKMGYTDLSKFCEGFFRQLLNKLYGVNLKDLNADRTNNPGLDLGDETIKKAYQITATKTSKKIIDTLEVLSADQLKTYENIKVLIIGMKQGSYSVDTTLLQRTGFIIERDIIDLDDILRDIVVLDDEILSDVFELFKREFRQLKMEFEPLDSDGHFESSLYHQLELKPNSLPLNAKQFLTFLRDPEGKDPENMKDIKEVYSKCASVPRRSRELIEIIALRGERIHDKYSILHQTLKAITKLSSDELDSDLIILENARLIDYNESEAEYNRTKIHICVLPSMLNWIIDWAIEDKINLSKVLTALDFTLMDEKLPSSD